MTADSTMAGHTMAGYTGAGHTGAGHTGAEHRDGSDDPGAARVLRVLVAEDNLVNCRVAQLLLKRLGHRVDTAGDGVQAVEAALRGLYDVVLMDLQMPYLDGLLATRQIRMRLPAAIQPRVIALTASALPADRAACLEAGMDDCLEKPLRTGDLEAALAGVGVTRRGHRRPKGGTDGEVSRVAHIVDRLGQLAGPDPVADDLLLPRLLTSFTDRANDDLDDLLTAVARHDLDSVGRLAHGLGGAAANLGATKLAAALGDVEDRSRSGLQDLGPHLAHRLRDELDLTMDAMGTVRQQLVTAAARTA